MNTVKPRRVKACLSVGPVVAGESYTMTKIVDGRYWIDVDGIALSYPLSYFYYIR
jgi:hypothetical protein